MSKGDEPCGGRSCHPRTEYCDPYESRCQGCDSLCSSGPKFDECLSKCRPYLQDAMSHGKVHNGGTDIKSLQILLGIVLAVTLTILILLIVMLTLKFKSKRKRIGSNTELHSPITMKQLTPERQVSNGIRSEPSRVTLAPATSVQTVSTNLTGSLRSRPYGKTYSPTQSNSSPTSPNSESTSNLRSSTSRIPTEDRIPENRNSYDNPGLDISSPIASSPRVQPYKNHLPPVRQNGHSAAVPGPYTISHSKVI